jgi:hypothetical protein
VSLSPAAAGHRAPAAAVRMSGRARPLAAFAVVGTANTGVFLVL